MLIPYQVDVPMCRWPYANVAVIALTVIYYAAFQGVASGGDSVAYWAHIGGFVAGLSLGAVLLLTRAVKMVDLERSLIDVFANRS